MLAHVTCAYDNERSPLEATVVDRCDTSLFLNRWYGERHHVALTTVCGDALEYAADRPFDLICTHSFLHQFDPESRRKLAARWHALLQPGGIFVTTQRVRPNDSSPRHAYTDEHARELSERAAAAARVHPQPLDVDPDDLAHAVYQYAIRRNSYVIRTAREITDPFEASGFDIELADDGGYAERERDRPASGEGTDTFRLRIVARKR
jgi:SAM-dependent methyltransferase